MNTIELKTRTVHITLVIRVGIALLMLGHGKS